MKRRLFAIAAVISSILCIATVVEWVCSYRDVDCMYFTKGWVRYAPENIDEPSTGWGILSSGGTIQFDWITNGHLWEGPGLSIWRWGPWIVSHESEPGTKALALQHKIIDLLDGGGTAAPREARHHFLSVGYDHQFGSQGFVEPMRPRRPTKEMRFLIVPDAYVAAVFLILPATFAWPRLRRPFRRGPNQCANCGYDLRASPARCPECGTMGRGIVTAE